MAVAEVHFVLLDNDSPQKNVGFVATVSVPESDPFVSPGTSQPRMDLTRHVLTLLAIPKGDSDFWSIGLRVDPTEIPFTRQGVYFDGNFCAGQAWILESVDNLEFVTAFDPHAVVAEESTPGSPDLDVRALYVADRSQPVVAARANSLLDEEGCRILFGGLISQFRPAVLLDADLHTTYPPSYDLRFELVE